jgi:hypothetical protein
MSDSPDPRDEHTPTRDPAVELDTDLLDELIVRLEGAAEQLRSGELSADAAATLVEECAVLANQAGAELARRMLADLRSVERSAGLETPAPGQGSLL